MKALLSSFELYFINYQGINKNCQTCRQKTVISHDCFELNGSKKLLLFYSVRLLQSILTRCVILTESLPV